MRVEALPSARKIREFGARRLHVRGGEEHDVADPHGSMGDLPAVQMGESRNDLRGDPDRRRGAYRPRAYIFSNFYSVF